MGLKLKWKRWDLNGGAFRYTGEAAGFRAVVGDDEDGGFFWLIRDQTPRVDGTLPTVEAAQEAAEAALARLLAEDEGLRALLVGQWRDPEKLEADNARALAWLEERDALRARVAELERASRWIPVGESLPDDETVVVEALDDDGVVLATCVDDGRRGEWWPTHESRRADGITHWRPLPAGPEVEK